MRRLLLLRHAKAVQDSGEGDHARALNERGRTDSTVMGRALNARGYIPDLVICSNSRRTTQTWELLSPELARAPKVEFTRSLYLAPPKALLETIQDSFDSAKSLMLVGHNPGIAETANRLARKPRPGPEAEKADEMRAKFPTCALAVLDFDVASWRDVTGGGVLRDFIRTHNFDD